MKRNMRTATLALSCFLGLSILNAAHADEINERNKLNEKIHTLYLKKDFNSLNSMYLNALNNKTKTASGTMLLWHYYQAFNEYYATLYADQTQAWKNAEQGLQRWQKQYPQSAAPKILQVRLLSAKADAYGKEEFLNAATATCDIRLPATDNISNTLFSILDKVSGEKNSASLNATNCYFAYQDLIEKYMQQIAPSVQNDPEWFTTQLDMFKSGTDNSKCQKAFNEGVKKHPGYYNIYFHGVTCHFSEDRKKRMKMRDDIARLAAANTKATNGDALYARVYWVISSYSGIDNLREETPVDWPRMQKSIQQVVSKYPTQWNYANFAQITCSAKDYPFTLKLFNHIPEYHASDWSSVDIYSVCKARAKNDFAGYRKGYDEYHRKKYAEYIRRMKERPENDNPAFYEKLHADIERDFPGYIYK